MIIAYVGTPGSGKSYEAVKKILDNLKLGRVVYTNIDGMDRDISREHIKVHTGLNDIQIFEQLHFLDAKQIIEFWKYAPNGSLVVVDEVHKLFSNRNWASETNKEFTEWASTHRHGGYDVLLITQDIEKIDKHARSLIEWTYFYKKINYFGSLVKNKYLRHSYDSDDHVGKPIDSTKFTYDPKIFGCYSSYDNSKVKELGIQKTVNVLNHPIFWSMPFVLIAMIYFLSQSSLMSGDVFGTKKVLDTAAKMQNKTQNEKISSSLALSPTSPPGGRKTDSEPKIKEDVYYPLNSITLFENGNSVITVIFQDRLIKLEDFPYKVVRKGKILYALISPDLIPSLQPKKDKTDTADKSSVPAPRFEGKGVGDSADSIVSN